MKKVLFFIIITIATLSCKQKPKEVTHEHTNALIHETSPYLLQHAHNPVNWEAWHPDVLERAKKRISYCSSVLVMLLAIGAM